MDQQSKLNQTRSNATKQVAIREANNDARVATAESSEAKLEQAKLNFSYTCIYTHRLADKWNRDAT
jgi:multidrug resistance efflux pump